MTKDRRLGRGLAALLGNPADAAGASANPSPQRGDQPHQKELSSTGEAGAVSDVAAGVERLPIDRIDPNPHQPRRQFDPEELETLAESLRTHCLLQPILVRQVGQRYQLVSGERRWRAAQMAGWDSIPATVRDADDQTAAEWSLIENLQRKDLSAIEKARSFQQYLRQYGTTQEQLAKQLQLDRSTVTNLLRLLELPEAVQQAVERGKLGAGHARALLPLGNASLQEEFSDKIIREGWSVRETERQVAAHTRQQASDSDSLSRLEQRANRLKNQKSKSRQTEALERELKMALGVPVEIQQSGKQSGKIVIHFAGHEEFERLHRLLVDGRVAREAA